MAHDRVYFNVQHTEQGQQAGTPPGKPLETNPSQHCAGKRPGSHCSELLLDEDEHHDGCRII